MTKPWQLNRCGWTAIALTLSFIGCLASCQMGAAPEDDEINIVCTTGMVADIARQVAGDNATVEAIMGPGVDPHLYTPTRADVVKLNQADVVFYNGMMLEGKMTDVFVRLARSGKSVHAVTELIEKDYVLTDDEDLYDPHIWMDVQGWIRAVQAVADSLGDYDPARAEQYHANAERYRSALEQLDTYAHQLIQSIPESRRVLVTAHDAFSYFGRAYDIDVRGIQGISTESEAGVRDINDLIDFIVERQIQAVFVETSVADKNVRALIEGAASKGHEVRIGGTLFSDAMGEPGTYEGTYVGMIDHNVTTITRALGGDAPELGMQGKLTLISQANE